MPDVAAFDFDGTLTTRGSVFGFLSAVAGRPAVLSASLALSPGLVHAAAAGGVVADHTKELLFVRVLDGIALERAEEVGTGFAHQHLAKHLRTSVRDRFDWHRRRGDRVVVVSASPELYVRPAGAQLGADGVVATRLAVRGEVLTGHYQGLNCRGDEKLRRLRQWIDECADRPERVWAYGNSRGDLRMLGAADIGVDVGRLGRLGRLRSFPGLESTGPGRNAG